MSDINWPPWSRDGQRLLALMPALRDPALTRGEVFALSNGWERAWRDPDYQAARESAFTALFDHRPFTISDDAFGVAWKRASESGEWRDDLRNHACHAATDAAIGRFAADWIEPASTTVLERVWVEVMETPGGRPAEPVFGPSAPVPDPGSVASFVDRCRSHGWDEAYADSLSTSEAYEGALRRCREETWAAGRDEAAHHEASKAWSISTPGSGCYPDRMSLLIDAFYDGLARTIEAVVARDLLDPADFDILLASWRSHFGDLP